MHTRRFRAGLGVVFCMWTAVFAFTDTLVIDALWIGNSFTAMYVLPNSLRTMFRGAKDDTYISLRNTEVIEWGQTLEYHYNNTDAMQTLQDGDFDIVVLQDFPRTGGPADLQSLEQYGTLFVNAALAKGAQPIIYWTWPSESNKAHLQSIIDMYETFCTGKDVKIAPVNVAWRHVFSQNSSYPLYNDDALHMSPYGHFLNMSVFYSIFKELSPAGNTYRVWGEYPSATPTLMDADSVAYLQAQAWAVVDSMLGPFATGTAPSASLRPMSAAAPRSPRVVNMVSPHGLSGSTNRSRLFGLNGARSALPGSAGIFVIRPE